MRKAKRGTIKNAPTNSHRQLLSRTSIRRKVVRILKKIPYPLCHISDEESVDDGVIEGTSAKIPKTNTDRNTEHAPVATTATPDMPATKVCLLRISTSSKQRPEVLPPVSHIITQAEKDRLIGKSRNGKTALNEYKKDSAAPVGKQLVITMADLRDIEQVCQPDWDLSPTSNTPTDMPLHELHLKNGVVLFYYFLEDGWAMLWDPRKGKSGRRWKTLEYAERFHAVGGDVANAGDVGTYLRVPSDDMRRYLQANFSMALGPKEDPNALLQSSKNDSIKGTRWWWSWKKKKGSKGWKRASTRAGRVSVPTCAVTTPEGDEYVLSASNS